MHYEKEGAMNFLENVRQMLQTQIENFCDNLNVIGHHKLIGSGNIRRCGLFLVDVDLLKEFGHYGGRL